MIAEEGSQGSLLPRMRTRSRPYEVLEYGAYAAFDGSVFDFTLAPGS